MNLKCPKRENRALRKISRRSKISIDPDDLFLVLGKDIDYVLEDQSILGHGLHHRCIICLNPRGARTMNSAFEEKRQ